MMVLDEPTMYHKFTPFEEMVFDLFKINLVKYPDRAPKELMEMSKAQAKDFLKFMRNQK